MAPGWSPPTAVPPSPAPAAPPPPRWRRRRGWAAGLAAAVAVAVAAAIAVAAYLYRSSRMDEGVYTVAPDACSLVDPEGLQDLVPGGTLDTTRISRAPDATRCAWKGPQAVGAPWLAVEVVRVEAKGPGAAAAAAHRRIAGTVRLTPSRLGYPNTLAAQPGLGDEAFVEGRISAVYDEDVPVYDYTVRFRRANLVATVTCLPPLGDVASRDQRRRTAVLQAAALVAARLPAWT
ncbi:hypothetical protein [Actinomadura fibrosa]|uniref:DUF3558 domain-containing protein n=1 Tax=Actinomadura fibrosa TaxID=111802 RepID=A0ABW2XK68_9ACTN|nr:hypothetical protein [Actinomadura fibrosa]